MNRLDRYILTQLLGPFGFFSLTFVGIIWLTQALGLIDRVIASNQSALVFLEFSTLILPQVLTIVLPLAAFGSTLYAVNRLNAESEMTVIQAAGRSYFYLVVPFLGFGVFVASLSFLTTLYLNPLSTTRLAQRMFDVRNEITNSFIGEGEFVHPDEGITLYVNDTSREGEMAGIFLNDQRNPQRVVTYSAQKALLLRENETARMIMFDGLAQTHDKVSDSMTSVQFSQFAYDLSELISARGNRIRTPQEFTFNVLLNPTPQMLDPERFTRGDYVAQAHDQIVTPLLALLFPALAFATIVSGPFRRGATAWHLVIAVAGATTIQLATILTKSYVRAHPDLAIASYLPPLFAGIIAVALLVRIGASKAAFQETRRKV